MKDKKNPKKKIIVSVFVMLVLGIFGLTKKVSAWGPERDTYTNSNHARQAVFNSIIDDATVGDERDFVRIVEIDSGGQKDDYAVSNLKIRPGYDYEVYIYYHNNAGATYNNVEENYKGVAKNVRLSATFPQSLKAGENGDVVATISADRTLVEKVWDEITISADEDVILAYVSDSAVINNLGQASGTVLSADDLFSGNGALLGYNTLNGIIYGGVEYAGCVVFQIRVTKAVEPSSTFEMDKKISKDGGETWLDNIEMEPGTEAQFKITFKNTGTSAQTVTAFDTLEDGQGMEYIIGSTRIKMNGAERIIHDENGGGLFSDGIEIGEVQSGETVEISYKVKLDETATFECGKTVLYNLASLTARVVGNDGVGVATSHDKVRIEVVRDSDVCLPAELPNTGPAELVLAGVVVAGLIVGVFYYINSKMTLKRLENEAKSGDLDKKEKI